MICLFCTPLCCNTMPLFLPKRTIVSCFKGVGLLDQCFCTQASEVEKGLLKAALATTFNGRSKWDRVR